jgi:S1-C subfamily serine protease
MVHHIKTLSIILLMAMSCTESLQDQISKVSRSIKQVKVVITTENQKDDHVFSGTTFAIYSDSKGTYLITSAHIIINMDILITPKKDINYLYEDADGKRYSVKIVYIDLVKDLALLYTTNKIKAIELSDEPPVIGSKLYYAGFPFGGLFGTVVSDGIVGSVSGACSKLGKDMFCFLASIKVGKGSSGSPVFNAKGELVGIVAGFTSLRPYYAVIISLDTIKTFLKEYYAALENKKQD